MSDEQIRAEALRKARYYPREFSKTITPGLTCTECGGSNTSTEFYRYPPDKEPSFGVTACDDCGAC